MKTLTTLLFILFVITSCSRKESEYNKAYWDVEIKKKELEYIKALNQYKTELSIKQQIQQIDSLELNFIKND